jgi:hypothetical protein
MTGLVPQVFYFGTPLVRTVDLEVLGRGLQLFDPPVGEPTEHKLAKAIILKNMRSLPPGHQVVDWMHQCSDLRL